MPPRLKPLRLGASLLSITKKTLTPALAPALFPAHRRCASILSSLADNPGAYNKRIRRGRGPASGKGKTAGRGQKGQHAHGKVPAGFEGGQTPQWITNPERGRGKYNPFRVEMSPINVDRIQTWIDQKRLDPSKPITMKELKSSRCIHGVQRHGVKLLARNPEQLTTPINIVVSRASAEAIARVEALGGSVTTRFYSPTGIKRVLREESHPIISLQAPSTLVALGAQKYTPISKDILSSLSRTPAPIENSTMAAIMRELKPRYKYRLADATSRKDIEYYRDPAHRGYLAYTLEKGESPSLFYKNRQAFVNKTRPDAKAEGQAQESNRLF